MLDYQKKFIRYALECGVLKFGQFQLKSNRTSPYFFNTGLFNTGAKLDKLGHFYAQALLHSGFEADVLYGPAYKGIPLACATAMAYSRITGQDMPFAFNRKEAKDHGEGGTLVGSSLQGRVVILDDVITAGTSVRESVNIIRSVNAQPIGVLIALDRQEQGINKISAMSEVEQDFTLSVKAIISLADIVKFLQAEPNTDHELTAIKKYQHCYGV
jgi:orotate phosphoribosyltransferase